MQMKGLKVLACVAGFTACGLEAGQAEVVDAVVHQQGAGTYRFDVTLRHADTGWDHYANRWDVLGPDGEVLGTRILHHPHVNEQPFTRSLSGVRIPAHVNQVWIRASDSVHGDSEQLYPLTLEQK
ncbi:MAG: hypothetical protein OIF55_06875 [Amphritea sp.]|nr:hypothetical protein [Amphritea sp.]